MLLISLEVHRPLLGVRLARSSGIAAALVLVSAAPLLAQEGDGGLFAVNWFGLFVWTWLIFILLFVVLRKWAWGPILEALDKRERRIQNAIDQATQQREEAEKLLAEQRDMLGKARGEAQDILAEGRKAGERLRAELLEEARKQKDQIVERSREEIRRERDEALAALRREAVDLSISAAGRVLAKNLDSKENRRLVEEYLDVLSKEGDESGSK